MADISRFLARHEIDQKVSASLLAWTFYLPAYALFAVADSVGVALLAGGLCGLAQGSAWVLVNAAAQAEIPDHVLGRVMGLIALVHRGAHATGLLFVSPLFAFVATRSVFAANAVALALVGLAGVLVARGSSRDPSLAPTHPRG